MRSAEEFTYCIGLIIGWKALVFVLFVFFVVVF
jgi:hypothetical protein